MRLYHGTNIEFEEIDLSKSRLGKDFGSGFYLTQDFSVAKRQAERRVAQTGIGNAVVLEYLWDEEAYNHLKTITFDGYTLEWAEFILLNRNNHFRRQIHDFDIVIGPIADDTVGLQIRRFEDGIISLSRFLEEIKFHHVTFQHFFATQAAISTLKRITE